MSDYDAIECTLCGYYYMRHLGACPNCYPEQASNTTNIGYLAIAYPNKLDSAVKVIEKAQKGQSKQRSKKIEADGYIFDSKLEYERYSYLKQMELIGEIWALTVHPSFVLLPAIKGLQSAVTYTPDFAYIKSPNLYCYEDVKGSYGKSRRNDAKNLTGKAIISPEARLRHKFFTAMMVDKWGKDFRFRIITEYNDDI